MNTSNPLTPGEIYTSPNGVKWAVEAVEPVTADAFPAIVREEPDLVAFAVLTAPRRPARRYAGKVYRSGRVAILTALPR